MCNNKKRCKGCIYGWMTDGIDWFFEGSPMCLYFHDTGRHRDGNDDYCNSFAPITENEANNRKQIFGI